MKNPWLQLIRVQNLAVLAYIFIVFRYSFLVPLHTQSLSSENPLSFALSDVLYALLILSVVLIAAGGNVINDINDKRADAVNRPGKNPIGKSISEKSARTLYWVLSISGVILGYFLAYVVNFETIGSMHLVAFFLLWIYSTDFKHRLLIGNFIIAFLAATAIVIIPVFDFIPANGGSTNSYIGLYSIYGAYAFFAFLTTFIREVIKDMEDVNGDRNVGSVTLATKYSPPVVKNIIFGLILVLLFGLGAVSWIFRAQIVQFLYIVLLLILPNVYLVYLVFKAKSQQEWSVSSKIVKAIMFVGISSVAVFTYIG